MSIIEEKGVKFTFDNSQFESAAAKTLDTLKNLASGMNVLESVKALTGLQGAIDGTKFDGLLSNIDSINQRFSVMGSFVHDKLYEMVNMATNAGKRLAEELTIVPVKSGLSEYETQINAVQTILSNTRDKGTTIKDVNAALDELNTYADLTIYNFTEMTKNIGTFTAAGLGLETSVSAIEGIANVAAISGSTSEQASRAMYQLSQALSSGTVKLMDWNSVVNAGMGGEVFKKALQETSRECVNVAKRVNEMSEEEQKAYKKQHHYTDDQMKAVKEYSFNVDELIEKEGSFRESLTHGWITSDVLARTLNKFTKSGAVEYVAEMASVSEDATRELQKTGDRFGYDSDKFKKQAKELADGNKEMAKSITHVLSQAADAEDAATKVKTFTQLIDTLKEALQSGWTQSWRTIIGDFEEARKFWTNVKDVFDVEIGASAKKRNDMLDEWAKSGGQQAFLESVYNLLDGVMNVKHEITDAFESIFKPITGKQLAKTTKSFRDFTESFKTATKDGSLELFSKGLKATFSTISIGIKGLKNLGGKISPLFHILDDVDTKPLTDSLGSFFDAIIKINESMDKGVKFNDAIEPWIKGITPLELGAKAMTEVGNAIDFTVDKISGLKGVAGYISDFFTTLKDEPDKVSDALQNSKLFQFLSSAKDFVGNMLSGVGEVVVGFGKTIKDGFVELFNSLNFDEFGKALSSANLGQIAIFMAAFSKVLKSLNGKDSVGGLFGNIANTIRNFSEVIADAIDKVDDVLEPVTRLFDGLKDTLMAWQTNLNADTLSKIAKALAILAGSLLIISAINPDKLSSSMSTLAGLFGELFGSLVIFSKLVNGENVAALMALGTIASAIARGILVLTVALKIISTIDVGTLGISVVALGAVVAYMLAFSVIASDMMKDGKNFAKGSKAFTKVAISVLILVGAMKLLSSIPTAQLWEGLIVVEALLGTLGGLTKLLSGTKGTAKAGVSFVLMASSMLILFKAVQMFGQLSPEQIDQGAFAVIGLLASLSAALFAGNFSDKMLTTSVSMIAVAAAMVIVSQAVKTLGEMDPENLGNGFLAFAGALLAMVVAIEVMQGNLAGAASMVILAAAMIPLALSIKLLSEIDANAAALGILVLAGALAVIITAGTFATPAAVGLLALSGSLFLLSAAFAVFGIGLTAVATGFSALVLSIAVGARTLLTSFPIMVQAFGAFIDGLAVLIPKIALFGANLVISFIGALLSTLSSLIGTVADFLVSFFEGLVQYAPPLIKAALDLMLAFMNGLADGVREYAPLFLDALTNLLEAALELVLSVIGEVAGLIPGIGPLISGGLDDLKTSMRNQLLGDDSKSVGKDAVGAITDGVNSATPALQASGENAGATFMGGLSSKLSEASMINDAFTSINFEETAKSSMDSVASASAGTFGSTFSSAIQSEDLLENPIDTSLLSSNFEAPATEAANMFSSTFDTAMPSDLGVGMFDSLGDNAIAGLSANEGIINNSITDMLNSVKANSEQTTSDFSSVGESMDTNVASGVDANAGKVSTSGANAGRRGATGAKTTQTNWYQAGSFMVDGIVSGINDNASRVYTAGYNAAKKGNKGAKDGADENSPSKIWYQIGAFMVQGAVNAINDFSGLLETAAYNTATNANDSFAGAINNLGDALEAPEDPTMDIRVIPVLDQSALREQMSSISSSMSSINLRPSMSIDAKTNSSEIKQLVHNTSLILSAIRNGSDLYLDEKVLAGRINRRLGAII